MGESSGVPNMDGYIESEFLSDYHAYVNSLEKMAACRPKFICLPHGGILTGSDAEGYFERSAEAAHAFKTRIEQLLTSEDGDEEKILILTTRGAIKVMAVGHYRVAENAEI